MTSKLQRSEFNNKEAIVLLSDLINLGSSMDEQIKSTITLSLNYLRQTESHPQQLIIETENDLEEGELERRQAAVVEWRKQGIPDRSSTELISPIDHEDGLDSLSSSSSHVLEPNNKSLFSDSSMTLPSTYAVHDDDNSFCTNCKQLLAQLDAQVEKQAYLKRDLGALASALSEEEDVRSMIEQDKEALEEDVANMTSSLFSIFNQILMDEVTDRDGLVKLNRETDGKLGQVLDAWDHRDSQLKQVKELLVQLDSIVHTSANASCAFSRRYSQQQQQQQKQQFSPIPTPTVSNARSSRLFGNRNSTRFDSVRPDSSIRIDGFVLTEFQNHLKMVNDMNNKVLIPSSPFVKRVFTEDVEPCLFFQQSQGWWKSPWFKKRLLDAILKGSCEIQGCNDSYSSSGILSAATTTTTSSSDISPATSHISTPSQQSVQVMPPKTKCACCNILRVCEFKMRLPISSNNKAQQQQQQQPWLPIDRFCRDRLVAVCGYYSFMSHLKLLSSSPTLSIFKQIMYHRRKMSLARIGSIGLFNEEEEDTQDTKRLSMSSSGTSRHTYQQQRRHRKNRESIVLDHSGSGSDTASVVSVSDLQGLDGTPGQIIIVH